MLNNYYTLLYLSQEFNAWLTGSRVIQASTNSKSRLDIIFAAQSGSTAGLTISCLPQDNFIYMQSSVKRNLKGANVLPEILGKTVSAIDAVVNERQMRINFSDRSCLRINLFGSSANIYYTGSDEVIVNSFLKPSTNIGKKLATSSGSINFPVDGSDLQSRFQNATGDVSRRLSKCIPTIDSILAREILYRYHLTAGSSGDEINFEILYNAFSEIRAKLSSPSPRLYLSEQDGTALALGLIELKHLRIGKIERYDSVNECVRDFVVKSARDKNTHVVKTDLIEKLNKKIDAIKRTLTKIEADLSNDRTGKYQTFGEYLMTHLEDVTQGDTSIIMDDGQTEIKLNPGMKPVQNAQFFFDRAKHARLSIQQAEQRKKNLTKELEDTEALLQKMERSDNLNIAKSIRKDNVVSRLVSSGGKESRSSFREFEKNGYRIYVGKDAKNNDALTFGFAKPNDVFLHARGVSGSHVIIRNSSRDYPQKEIIRFAASIAGHYSKARTSSIVPVAYTMRKFVKKAKGKPGAVFLDREEVIFVKPEIPEQEL